MWELILHIASALWLLVYLEGTLDLFLYGKESSLLFAETCSLLGVEVIQGEVTMPSEQWASSESRLATLEWVEEVLNWTADDRRFHNVQFWGSPSSSVSHIFEEIAWAKEFVESWRIFYILDAKAKDWYVYALGYSQIQVALI